jgi:hypothetical protein
MVAGDDQSHAKETQAREQEDRTAQVITSLTDVEARGTTYVHDVHRDLQVLGGHLHIYDKVAERAAGLWDAVSIHIVSQRRIPQPLRQSVELLHQVLLQGVGDLAELAARTSECAARVGTATDQLYTDFDDRLTESHPGKDGLRAAIVRAGLFEKVTNQAKQTQQEANRVKTMYDELLRTMGYAFDEWRVRESDVIQRLSGVLGGFLALIGIVTVFDATVNLKPSDGDATMFGWPPLLQVIVPTSGVITSWIAGGGLLLAIVWMIVQYGRSGRLGSQRFRLQYTGRPRTTSHDALWRLFRDTSTEHLDTMFPDDGHTADGTGRSRSGSWHDSDLAARFARHWDRAAELRPVNRRDPTKRDIEAVASQIEQWAVRSLLFTERTRQLYRYPLPRLTCLYRCCARMPGSPFGDSYAMTTEHRPLDPDRRADPLKVDLSEFALAMAGVGLTWDEALELDQWLIYRRPKTAHEVLALLEDVEMTAPMERDAIQRMLTKIRRELTVTPDDAHAAATHEAPPMQAEQPNG